MLICNHLTIAKSSSRLFASAAQIPYRKVALVLGTSPQVRGGQKNPYYYNRIEAAAQLYKAGKVDYFVLSGDNHLKEYNEPAMMKNSMVAAGVPDSLLYLDFAGFRTLDSVVRLKTVFRQDSVIVVSQKFQNERAICIALAKGIDAIGLNAKDINRKSGLKTRLREYPARVKMFLDLALDKQPHFAGEAITIGTEEY